MKKPIVDASQLREGDKAQLLQVALDALQQHAERYPEQTMTTGQTLLLQLLYCIPGALSYGYIKKELGDYVEWT